MSGTTILRGAVLTLSGLAVAATAAVEQAPIVKVDQPGKTGDLSFKLTAPDGSNYTVTRTIDKTWTPARKAREIAACVNKKGAGALPAGCTQAPRNIAGDWRAHIDDNELWFKHKEGGKFVFAKTLTDLKDGSQEITRFALPRGARDGLFPPEQGRFQFKLPPVPAPSIFGFTDETMTTPSHFGVETTGAQASVFPAPGMPVETIVLDLFSQLQAQGANVRMVSPVSFDIIDTTPDAYMSFVSTDFAVGIDGAGGSYIVPEPGTLAFLGSSIVLLGMRRKRSAC